LSNGNASVVDNLTPGFNSLVGSVIPTGATLTQVQLKVSNFVAGTLTGTDNGPATGSDIVSFDDFSNLTYGTVSGTPFYSADLTTEKDFQTWLGAPPGTFPQTKTINLWANATPGGIINVGPNTLNGSHIPTQLVPPSQSGDVNYISQPNSNFLSGATIPILWESTDVANDGASNVNISSKVAYAGVRIEVDYLYDLPTQQTGSVPEPATLLLLGSGLSFVAMRLRRRSAQ